MKPSLQLPLGIQLGADVTFDNFFVSKLNRPAVYALQNQSELFVFIYGPVGVGCSHLLQAACQKFQRSLYLPMAQRDDLNLNSLDRIEQMDLICIDDMQCIEGDSFWQEQIFFLFNRIQNAGKRLLIAAHKPPKQLSIELQDLKSRLAWGLVMAIHRLDDSEKIQALRQRAYCLGMHLSDEVGKYIISHTSRDTHGLFDLLGKLDQASLREKRKLTIPFVKKILSP